MIAAALRAPCASCADKARCEDRPGMVRDCLFAWAADKPLPVCDFWREACWHGIDGVFLPSSSPHPTGLRSACR